MQKDKLKVEGRDVNLFQLLNMIWSVKIFIMISIWTLKPNASLKIFLGVQPYKCTHQFFGPKTYYQLWEIIDIKYIWIT